MEKQSESVIRKNLDASSILLSLNEALQHKQQQLENLRRENETLTKDLNEMKKSEEGQRINFNLLETALQQIKLKIEQKDTKILDMIHENGTLKGKLEIQSEQFLVTLEQNNEIAELKQKLADLHYKDMISSSSRYCTHCSSTKRELENMRRENNQMRVANEKLKEKLYLCAKDKILQTDSEKTNEIQSGIKKAIESFCIQQMTTHPTNLIPNKRQIEGSSVSQSKRACVNNQENAVAKELADHPMERINDPRKPTCDEENSRQLPEINVSYGPAASTPKSNQNSFRCHHSFITIAEIHPEPVSCNLSTQMSDECKTNIANESTDDVICVGNETVGSTRGEKTIIRDRCEELEADERRKKYSDEEEPTTQTNNESGDENTSNESDCCQNITVISSRRTSADDDPENPEDPDIYVHFKPVEDYDVKPVLNKVKKSENNSRPDFSSPRLSSRPKRTRLE